MAAGRAVKGAVKRALGFSGVKQVQVRGGPARGIRMWLDFTGHTPMYLGMYEWELHRFLRTALPGTSRIFDIGGYLGYYALTFAANTAGHVVSFEPNPQNANRLRQNLALNPLLERRIAVHEIALGREDGDGALSLDSAAASLGAPDLIKIDIEGAELDALAGGLQTLREKRPHLIVETHSPELERQCGALMVECGYRPVVKHNRRIWREYRPGVSQNRWLIAAGDPEKGE
jgi:hypothetical protein